MTCWLAIRAMLLLGVAPFASPAEETPASVVFDRDQPARLSVRTAKSGHLLVHPRIDDRDLGWFIFDSGAGASALSVDAAIELSLKPVGRGLHRGVSEAMVPFIEWEATQMTLGPATFHEPRLIGMDLEYLSKHMGRPIGGILGYEVFSECVVVVDFSESTVELHDSDAYQLPHGDWQGLMIYQRTPFVRGSFEGHQGVFRVDTGAAQDTVTFHAPAVKAYDLLEGRSTRPRTIFGSAGSLDIRVGTMTSFELAGRTFETVSVGFATQDVGAFSDVHTAGNIGGQFLEPFTVVFDYKHARIGFLEED